jgi:hypothetical protein
VGALVLRSVPLPRKAKITSLPEQAPATAPASN